MRLGLDPALYNLISNAYMCKDTVCKGTHMSMKCGGTLFDLLQSLGHTVSFKGYGCCEELFGPGNHQEDSKV